MNQYVRHAILLLCLAISHTLSAQTVSVADAQARAQAFFQQQQGAHRAPGPTSDVQLAYTSARGAETYYYVFNDLTDGGFVIVGGDEFAPTDILGYSDHGSFSYQSAPDGLKWLLSQYEAETHASMARGTRPALSSHRAEGRGDSRALVTSQWGQQYPYNSAIPMGKETEPPYAGCVPIAMAQIMNYHQHPLTGTGSNAYNCYDDWAGIEVHYAADFGQTTYDWAHIRDTYDDNSTPQEIDAVSTLVYHAGVAIRARYGWYQTLASSPRVPSVLINHFGYDASARYVSRKYYDVWDWEWMVQEQLEAGLPIFYHGGGHAFVCHGYDPDTDLYAINWGWEGQCDGYYRLVGKGALNSVDDEGNSHGQYNEREGMVINIKPDCGGSSVYSLCAYSEVLLSDGETPSEVLYLSASDPKTIRVTDLNPINYSNCELSFLLGAIVRHRKSGAELIFCSSDYVHTDPIGVIYMNHSNEGYYSIDISIPSSRLVLNGDYDILPAYQIVGTDEWKEITLPIDNRLTVNISDGQDVETINVDYTMTEAGWGTICLPFNSYIPYGLNAYIVSDIDGNQLNLIDEYYLRKNQPYLLEGSAGDYSFHGYNTIPLLPDQEFHNGLLVSTNRSSTSDQPFYAPTGSYVLQNHEGQVAFYRVTDQVPVPIRQFHAYLQLPPDAQAQSAPVRLTLPGTTQAIQSLTAPAAGTDAIYDLQGIRIPSQRPGLQIRQGQLQFVK